MKNNLVLGLMMLSLFTMNAQAKEVCKTIADCEELKTQIEVQLKVLLNKVSPKLGSIVKESGRDRVRMMSQYDAERYCQDQGSRLPTARELARFSQSMGAKGIRETAYPNVSRRDAVVENERYQMISKYEYYPIYTPPIANTQVVDFYFNHHGYQRPEGALGDYSFWSSSVHRAGLAYVLIGFNGEIHFHAFQVNNTYDVAVRCMQ